MTWSCLGVASADSGDGAVITGAHRVTLCDRMKCTGLVMECESRKPRRKKESITFHEPTKLMNSSYIDDLGPHTGGRRGNEP